MRWSFPSSCSSSTRNPCVPHYRPFHCLQKSNNSLTPNHIQDRNTDNGWTGIQSLPCGTLFVHSHTPGLIVNYCQVWASPLCTFPVSSPFQLAHSFSCWGSGTRWIRAPTDLQFNLPHQTAATDLRGSQRMGKQPDSTGAKAPGNLSTCLINTANQRNAEKDDIFPNATPPPPAGGRMSI